MDVVITVTYISEGATFYGWASAFCLGLNLLLQSFFMVYEYSSMKWHKQVLEQIFVWTCTRPGIDAWRLATQKKQEKGEIVDPQMILTTTKTMELFAESIPNTVIQLSAIFNTDKTVTPTVALALISSFMTAAVLSTVTSHEYDSSKEKQRFHPCFYGFVPKKIKSKVGILLVMVVMSAFNLICRALSCILFYESGGIKLFLYVFGGEFLAYIGYKLLRRDFLYWWVSGREYCAVQNL